jgi:transposase, IS5 family
MYKKHQDQPIMENLPLFFDKTLNQNNRWVKLAEIIPWKSVDEVYQKNFTSNRGPQAISSRTALAALIIQIKLNLTDEETVNQIVENPYLQYFIGLESFQEEEPFNSSMMTHFRKRLKISDIKEIDQLLHDSSIKKEKKETIDRDDDSDNKGQLIVDATCAPADIHYPTDLGLLNKAREKTECMIDILWTTRNNKEEKLKPRTYRKKGRNIFLGIIKMKRPGRKKIRKAIQYQLNCIRRNLKSIEELNKNSELKNLGSQLYKDLLVIQTLYTQQQELYDQKKKSISDRIVSISQPHVRPIIRGKASAKTEFGAKISISLVDGWSFVDTVSFNAYNEGVELQEQIEMYKERFGYFPESVHADQIYRNRDNRIFCKKHGIRLSGPKLGRPSSNQEKLKALKIQEYADEGIRNTVEGRFGVGKRRYGLDKIMTKLKGTSETVIALVFMVMNMDTLIHFLSLYHFGIINIRDLCKEIEMPSYDQQNDQLFTNDFFADIIMPFKNVIIQ